MLFRSGFACVCKKTGSANPCGVRVLARCFCCAYCWPRLALHGLHAGTKLEMSFVPPASLGSRWSASVAWFTPHQWHTALPLSSTFKRLCLNSFWLRCLLLFVVAIAHAPTACASAAQAPCSRWCWSLLMSGLPRLCWFVIGMSMLEQLKPNAVMLYPTGCLNPSTLHYLAGYVYSPPQHVTQLGACRSTHVTVFYTCHLARGVGLGACRLSNSRGV